MASRNFLARHMFRAIHHAPMAATNVAAVSQAPTITCGKAARVVLLVITAQKLFIAGRLRSSLHSTPTGCCMNEFAAMMKYADAVTPIVTNQIVAR